MSTLFAEHGPYPGKKGSIAREGRKRKQRRFIPKRGSWHKLCCPLFCLSERVIDRRHGCPEGVPVDLVRAAPGAVPSVLRSTVRSRCLVVSCNNSAVFLCSIRDDHVITGCTIAPIMARRIPLAAPSVLGIVDWSPSLVPTWILRGKESRCSECMHVFGVRRVSPKR